MEEQMKRALVGLFRGKLTGAMLLYMETCARCGVCADACHVYAAMPEARYTAAGRAEVIRKLYKRLFTASGRIVPSLSETTALDDAAMDRVYDAAWSCTGCRRCMTYCPFGVDTQVVMSVAKALLIGADREPKVLSMLADMSIMKGENWQSTRADYEQALENLAPEVNALWPAGPGPAGRKAIPVGVEGADVLYVALSGKHSMVPAAAIMNAAGENWTLSYFEAVNFGAFVGDGEKTQAIARRILDEAARLKVREVAVVECGTAFRVLKYMTGSHPFRVVSFVELIARYLKGGRIRLRGRSVSGTLTYHDPCQLARNGGVIEEPRYVLSRLTADFVELSPNRDANWCCGGGGGLIAMGEKEFRMKSGRVKAEQLRFSGAAIVTTACENCHTQLTDLNEHYGLGMKVESLTHLVAGALAR